MAKVGGYYIVVEHPSHWLAYLLGPSRQTVSSITRSFIILNRSVGEPVSSLEGLFFDQEVVDTVTLVSYLSQINSSIAEHRVADIKFSCRKV